jgi:integrase
VVWFLYATGMRVGQARQLEWRDVDGTVLRFRGATTKNNSGADVADSGRGRRDHRRGTPASASLVRKHLHRDGQAIGLFLKNWATATKAAGHPDLLVHDLRHSAVRNPIRSGVPERIARGVTGHNTRAVFDRYDSVSAANLDAGLQTVAAYFANASKTRTIESLPDRDSDEVSESEPAAALSR